MCKPRSRPENGSRITTGGGYSNKKQKKGETMTAYYYKDKSGRIQQINLNPMEYHEEAKKHKLYNTIKEARKEIKTC